jgi:hypothetical protein
MCDGIEEGIEKEYECYKNEKRINKLVDCKMTNIDIIKLQKMAFIYNALENGWSVKKKNGCYVFKKKHEDREEIFLESYLSKFIHDTISYDEVIL